MSRKEFIKRIPVELQQKICLQRFKISLNKVEEKDIERIKYFLDLKSNEIFEDETLQTKDKAINYLKVSLQTYLNNKNIKNLKEINTQIQQKIELSNAITIQSIIEKAIEKRKSIFNKRMEILKNKRVDTNIKIDSTIAAYKAILKSVNSFFGKDFFVKNLNYDLLEKYALQFNNRTYIAHLKSIFKDAKLRKVISENPFLDLKVNKFYELENSDVVIDIFYNFEIENILNELETKEQKEELKQYFLTLLHSGMRNDELASIQKFNIRNDCFYFKDSKAYFNKIVPIHHTLIDYINNKIKDLDDNDYLFLKNNKSNRRVSQIRDKFNSLKTFKEYKKTLHNTRSTFVTYCNFYFANNYNQNYVNGLTHKNKGVEQERYNKTLNLQVLIEIVNKIDLKNLDRIERQTKLTEY